jgi:hypothetical protein
MLFLNQAHRAQGPTPIIGLIFTSFFGLGLFLISVYPTSDQRSRPSPWAISWPSRPADTLQLADHRRSSRLPILLVKVEGPDGRLLR